MSRHPSVSQWRKPGRLLLNQQINKYFKYDNFLILDFESTCERNVMINKQEIIEFPCIWVNSQLSTLSTFHRYVKPVHNPTITPFCTELTGINQGMVENEDTFDSVLANFLQWYDEVENVVGKHQSKTFVTCGNWDLDVMLPSQCQLSNVKVPTAMTSWLNLKDVFKDLTNYYPKSLKDMCKRLNVPFNGREHSGIDDCKTMLDILKALKGKHMFTHSF